MYRLEICQLVIIRIDADAEEQPRVPPINDPVLPEFNEVGLMLLVPRCDQAVHLALELYLIRIGIRSVPFGQTGFAPGRGGLACLRLGIGVGVGVWGGRTADFGSE